MTSTRAYERWPGSCCPGPCARRRPSGPLRNSAQARAYLPFAPAARLQIETVQLSSECAIKTLEAELAGTKSSLAGLEAAFKSDKASWGADLEGAKYEVRVCVPAMGSRRARRICCAAVAVGKNVCERGFVVPRSTLATSQEHAPWALTRACICVCMNVCVSLDLLGASSVGSHAAPCRTPKGIRHQPECRAPASRTGRLAPVASCSAPGAGGRLCGRLRCPKRGSGCRAARVPQGSRLKRELERVTEERDRAREEGKRAEQLRQQLELDLKVWAGARDK